MLPKYSIQLKLLISDIQYAKIAVKKWKISGQSSRENAVKAACCNAITAAASLSKRKLFAASANVCAVTFIRPQHAHGFSLLQSGRIKRRRGGRRRNGQRLTIAYAQFDAEKMPTGTPGPPTSSPSPRVVGEDIEMKSTKRAACVR